MIDVFNFGIMAGIMLVGALLYVVGINIESFKDRRRIRRQIKKNAAEEHWELLFQHAVYQKGPERTTYRWLYVTIAGIAFSLVASLTVEDGAATTLMFPWSDVVVAIFIFLHLLVAAAMGIWVLLEVLGGGNSDLRVRDFLTSNEAKLLLKIDRLKAEREGGEREFVKKNYEYDDADSLKFCYVYMPEILLPLLEQRDELSKYIQVWKELIELEQTDSTLLKPEQVDRNKAFQQGFHESLKKLEPLLFPLSNAVSQDFQAEERKKKLNKEQIQQDFDQKQQDAEQRLQALRGIVQNEKDPQATNQPLPESMLELYRVAKSETVSPELREEAADLLERIEEMQEQDKNRQKREMSDMEAVAVIKANALLHRLEDDGRAS